jgi:ATP-dependent helicase/nuclease subunit A
MKGTVRKRGDSWYYRFDIDTADGTRKQVERRGGNTKKEALVALDLALKEFLQPVDNTQKTSITVSEYYEYWYKEYAEVNCKYQTCLMYISIIDIHINPLIGSLELNKLTPLILQEFLNQKYREGLAKNTIANIYGVLSGALKKAFTTYKFLNNNLMQYVKMPKFDETKNDKEDLKIISIEDYKKILNRFPEGNIFYIPLQIGFNTGLRVAEVCGLTWDCIDLIEGSIEVNKILICKKGEWVFGTPKTESSYRKILISKTLIGVLKKHKLRQYENKLFYGEAYITSDVVCTKEDGSIVTTNSFKYLSHVVNKKLGINFNFHSLRHTHATMLLERNANFKFIQKRLGHSKLETTMDIYSHVTEVLSKSTVSKLEQINDTLKSLPSSEKS